MKYVLFLIITILLFTNCNSGHKDSLSYAASSEDNTNEVQNSGKRLMETNCYICHSPSASHDNRLAPPMIAVKQHYMKKGESKEDFVTAIQEWVKNPNLDDVKMFGAVRRFGLMPKANYSDDEIRAVAEYLYDNDIEKPEWFDAHQKGHKKTGR